MMIATSIRKSLLDQQSFTFGLLIIGMGMLMMDGFSYVCLLLLRTNVICVVKMSKRVVSILALVCVCVCQCCEKQLCFLMLYIKLIVNILVSLWVLS